MADLPLQGAFDRANIIPFTPRPRPLRADVPPFDPNNDAHLRAWESLFAFASFGQASDRQRLEAQIEAQIAALDVVDGDSDLEDGDEDCCPAFEDRLWSMGQLDDWTGGAGDPEDAEESEQTALAI